MYHFQRKHTQCEKDNLNIHVVSKRNQYSGIGHLPLFSWWSRKKNKACEQTLRVREMPLRGPTHTDTQTHTQLHCKTRLHFRQNAQVVRFTVAPERFCLRVQPPRELPQSRWCPRAWETEWWGLAATLPAAEDAVQGPAHVLHGVGLNLWGVTQQNPSNLESAHSRTFLRWPWSPFPETFATEDWVDI